MSRHPKAASSKRTRRNLAVALTMFVVFVMHACANSQPSARVPDHPVTDTALRQVTPAALAPGAAASFHSRILVARHTYAGTRLTSDEVAAPVDTESTANPQAPEVYVVVEAGAKPRILTKMGGWRLLLYVDPRDAATVVVAKTRLCPDTAGTHASNGLTLYPGLVVGVLETRNDKIHVSLDDADVHAQGWVPKGVLGTVFVPMPIPADRKGLVDVVTPARLLFAPGGALVSDIKPGAVLAAKPIGPPQSALVPVLLRGVRAFGWDMTALAWEASGFLPATALGRKVGETGVGPPGPSALTLAEFPARFPKGTRLFDRPSGLVIGIAETEAVAALPGPAQKGWQAITVPTPWGPREVWIMN